MYTIPLIDIAYPVIVYRSMDTTIMLELAQPALWKKGDHPSSWIASVKSLSSPIDMGSIYIAMTNILSHHGPKWEAEIRTCINTDKPVFSHPHDIQYPQKIHRSGWIATIHEPQMKPFRKWFFLLQIIPVTSQALRGRAWKIAVEGWTPSIPHTPLRIVERETWCPKN